MKWWGTLRTTFFRREDNKSSDCGDTIEEKRQKWKFFEAMEFLKQYRYKQRYVYLHSTDTMYA